MKFTPTNWVGAPDRLIILPRGQIGFVEVKALGQRTRPLQEAWHRQLRKLGCYVATLDDPARVNTILDEIERFPGGGQGRGGDPCAGEG